MFGLGAVCASQQASEGCYSLNMFGAVDVGMLGSKCLRSVIR